MTVVDPLILAFEQALDAQAAALGSTDPVALERSNLGLAEVVGQLRGRIGAADGLPPPDLQQLRSRLEAHGAMLARAASGNRAALAVLGLPPARNALVAIPADPRRGTHLLA